MTQKISILFFCISIVSPSVQMNAQIPESFRNVVGNIQVGNIGNIKPSQEYKQIDENTLYISFGFDLPAEVKQDDWQVNITPAFVPSFNWAPHLTPTDEHIIDQHVFRTPAMIVSDDKQVLTIIPDVEILLEGTPVRWYIWIWTPKKTS